MQKTVKIRDQEVENRLVVVMGHAPLYLTLRGSDPTNESSWFLQSFQKGGKEHMKFIEHIEAGVQEAARQRGILAFSGTRSRIQAGPISEAQSYWAVADHFNWFGHPEVKQRTILEEQARDSCEQVPDNPCRFNEVLGNYPATITLVGWKFKTERFDFHRETMRIPKGIFTYLGVNNPVNLEAAVRGELETLKMFRKDPYGSGPELDSKRRERAQFKILRTYEYTCPEVAGLLRHKGPELYKGPLPWDPSPISG